MNHMEIKVTLADLESARHTLPKPAAWDEGIATMALDALILLAEGGTVELNGREIAGR